MLYAYETSKRIKLYLASGVEYSSRYFSEWIAVTQEELHAILNAPIEHGNWIRVRIYRLED